MSSLGSVRLVLAVLLVVSGGGVARADDAPPATRDREAAREHFRKGDRLYRIAEYAAALEEFKAAFVLVDDPVFIFNIAQCHRQLGRTAEAIDFYERYLRHAPRAPNRAEVERRIEELKAREREAQLAPPPVTTPPQPVPTLTPTEPAAIAVAPAEPGDKPLYTKWWLWAGVAGVAVAVTAIALAASSSGSSEATCPGVSTCYAVSP